MPTDGDGTGDAPGVGRPASPSGEPVNGPGAATDGGVLVQLAGDRRMVPVQAVIEVLRDARLVRVPGAAAAVRGLINHRGRILVVADCRVALGLTAESAGDPVVVVVQWDNRRFGLAVDGVVEVLASLRTGLADVPLDAVAAAIFA